MATRGSQSELQGMIRKRDRLYNKIKKMENTKMRNDYKHLKHLVQKETCKSYWDYIVSNRWMFVLGLEIFGIKM
jgi:trans-2-enoyl-CoA reductase